LIEDYVERETSGARKLVQDPEAAVQQEQEDKKNDDNAELTNRESGKTFLEIMVTVRDRLSDLASSNDREDEEDEDDEQTEQDKVREDDELGRVIGTISQMVQ
jgi:hypothetical protein